MSGVWMRTKLKWHELTLHKEKDHWVLPRIDNLISGSGWVSEAQKTVQDDYHLLSVKRSDKQQKFKQ